MKKGAEAGVFLEHPSRVSARSGLVALAPIVTISAFLPEKVQTSDGSCASGEECRCIVS